MAICATALLDAARAILEEEVARGADACGRSPRRAGRQPCRALSPFSQSRSAAGGTWRGRLRGTARGTSLDAGKVTGSESDRIANIGAAYMRFVAKRPALARLMFGPQLPNRDSFPTLGASGRRHRQRDRHGAARLRAGPGGMGGGAWPGHAGAGECHRSGPAPFGLHVLPAARRFCCAACSRRSAIKPARNFCPLRCEAFMPTSRALRPAKTAPDFR